MSEQSRSVLVGVSDFKTASFGDDIERQKFFMRAATLNNRTSRVTGRNLMSVTVEWPTSEETYPLGVDGEMTFHDGEEVDVLMSTIDSTSRGCWNGHAVIEAVQLAPGDWSPNTRV